jgi:hypothetical protein
MSNRRRFIKSIAGALVASAMPKSVLSIGEKPEIQVRFYEKEAMERQAKRLAEFTEKMIWGSNPILHHQDIPNPNKEL